MKVQTTRTTSEVLGTPIDVVTWDAAITRIAGWAAAHKSTSVCFCNVHSVVTAQSDPALAQALADADLAAPDGAPVAWLMRRQGHPEQGRVSGPDLMWRYFSHAQGSEQSVFLYGSSDATLTALCQRMRTEFPQLRIAGAYSPPFRPLSAQEDEDIVQMINHSGANTVWVGLGCPKQEIWMHQQKGRIQAVMLGVGAAFDFNAGLISRAPAWMRHTGLEWLHRLGSEPGRLWRRYLSTNTAFIVAVARQLLVGKHSR